MVHSRFEHAAAVTGLGQSTVGRRLGRSALDLTVLLGDDGMLALLRAAGYRVEQLVGL